MSVKIRLARHGAKKRPFYRIVVAQSEAPRDGRFLEIVGTYNPLTEPATIAVEGERVKHWIANGAVPSATVHSILKKAGVYQEAPAE